VKTLGEEELHLPRSTAQVKGSTIESALEVSLLLNCDAVCDPRYGEEPVTEWKGQVIQVIPSEMLK